MSSGADVRRNRRPAKNHVRAWRKLRGLTQEQLAEAIEMSAASISQLERSKQGVTGSTLVAIAEALRCEPGDLLSVDPKGTDYLIWQRIRSLPPDKRTQALRLLRLFDDDA